MPNKAPPKTGRRCFKFIEFSAVIKVLGVIINDQCVPAHQQVSTIVRSCFQLLTYAYNMCIFIQMRTTLNIDDQILKKASKLTGISEKTALVRLGLEALIAQESAKRLASLGGSEKDLKKISRRKSYAK